MEISDDAYQLLKNDWTMWCVLNMFKGDKNTKSTGDANLEIKIMQNKNINSLCFNEKLVPLLPILKHGNNHIAIKNTLICPWGK